MYAIEELGMGVVTAAYVPFRLNSTHCSCRPTGA